ncbi:MAG: hypothetical protein AAB662_04570 [Patescibacteria group bacterium]
MSQQENRQVPEFLRSYFWDVVFEELEVKTHAFLIIKRVLDKGNLRDIRWLIKTYGKDAIKKVVMSTRDLARPTGNFWADMLALDKHQVPCLQKPYSPIRFGLSS